ncbi:hypothetical protein LWI28_001683 [Acer negundo]|uniref:Uncharacterized protein n=1 Tax=Acer negundo TaxID=4023 RepID=A0AAD5NW34_ACENE|nr:hypothetical protein LWI28_001683 [Acer negundo]
MAIPRHRGSDFQAILNYTICYLQLLFFLHEVPDGIKEVCRSWVSGNLEFGGVDYPGIGVNSIHTGIMAVEASTKSNLVNNFDDDDDDGPVFFVRNNVASRQNQVNPDVRKPSSSTFNGQNSNAQKGKTPVPSSKQTVDRENEEASQDDQDRGKKRTNDESEINKEVVGGSKGKKAKLGGAAKLSKQIDRLVEVVESTSATTPVYRSSQGTSIPEVMEVVATLPGAERGSQLWWFATELFCSQDKREMFSVMTDPDLKLQFMIRNQKKSGN